MEEAKKMKCHKRLIFKQLSKSQVFVAHSFWVICQNVSRTFVELCNERLILVHRFGAPIWLPETNRNISHLEFTFLAYVRINISSNTWNGYTTENQEERLFFQRDSIPILVSRTAKTRKFKLLYFRNETCYGNGKLYKDLLLVYLQPSEYKNS